MKELLFITFSICLCNALVYQNNLRNTGIPKLNYRDAIAQLRDRFDNDIHAELLGISNAPFVAKIGFGTPPQYFNLLFDTGSSNILLPSTGCAQPNDGTVSPSYNASASSTYQPNGTQFSIGFASGSFDGYLSSDLARIGGARIKQIFAEIKQCPLIYGAPFDGIVGLGYSPDPTMGDGIATLVENMFDQRVIHRKIFSIRVNRNPNGDNLGGEIIFGGTHSTRCIDDFTYIPLTDDGYWTISVDGIFVDNQSISSNNVAYIDTGSSLIVTPSTYIDAINAAINVTSSGTQGPITYYTISCETENLPNIHIILNGKSFELEPTDYTVKMSPTECVSVFATVGIDIWVLGQPFVQVFDSIFDLQNNRIGFAAKRVKNSGK